MLGEQISNICFEKLTLNEEKDSFKFDVAFLMNNVKRFSRAKSARSVVSHWISVNTLTF